MDGNPAPPFPGENLLPFGGVVLPLPRAKEMVVLDPVQMDHQVRDLSTNDLDCRSGKRIRLGQKPIARAQNRENDEGATKKLAPWTVPNPSTVPKQTHKQCTQGTNPSQRGSWKAFGRTKCV